MTISWSNVVSRLRWITSWKKPVARQRALALIVLALLLGMTSHAVMARPWGDHGALARTIVEEAACASAETLLQGGAPLEIKTAAIDHLVKGGFREVHGSIVLVTHRSNDHGLNRADFSVAVSIVHQDKHYLLEELIDYRPSWAVQSVVVDEASFNRCTRDLIVEA